MDFYHSKRDMGKQVRSGCDYGATMVESFLRMTLGVKLSFGLALTLLATSAFADDLAAQDRRSFADGLMSRGLHALALREYAALAESTPANEGLDIILARLAECQRRTGDNAGADATCNRFAREFPQSPQRFSAAITHAMALSALGDPLRASRAFDVISAETDAPWDLRLTAMYFAGENYFNVGNYELASMRFEMLLAAASASENTQAISEFCGFATLYLAEIEAKRGDEASVTGALARYAAAAAAPQTPRIGAEALFKGAFLAYTSGRYDEAVARFSRLFSQYPNDSRIADARLPAAWANFNAGRFAEASALVNRILVKNAGTMPPKDVWAEALYIEAAAQARLGNGERALGVFSQLLQECPGSRFDAHARYERLVILFKSGRHEALLAEARTFSDPPAELAPDVLWLQAEAAEALEDGGRAAQFYAMLASRHPSSPLASEALYRSARHLREAKSWLEASKSYQRLALNHPDSPLVPYALYESGCCLAMLDRREEAVRDFDAFLEKFPDHKLVPEVMLQKGVSQRAMGLVREAGATLDALTARYGASEAAGKASFERARIFYESGDYPAAEKLLKPLANDASTLEARREASFLLGLCLHAQGRAAEAAALFQPLLEGAMRERLPADRLVWLAEFQYSQGRCSEASNAASELLRRDITDEMRQAANVIIARSQLALSNTNAAIAAFRAAAESPAQTKFSAEAALRLAELLANGDGAMAAQQWFRVAIERAGGDGQETVRARAYRGLAAAHEASGNTDEALRLYLAVSLLYDGGEEVFASMADAERLLRVAGRAAEADAIRDDRESRIKSQKEEAP